MVGATLAVALAHVGALALLVGALTLLAHVGALTHVGALAQAFHVQRLD